MWQYLKQDRSHLERSIDVSNVFVYFLMLIIVFLCFSKIFLKLHDAVSILTVKSLIKFFLSGKQKRKQSVVPEHLLVLLQIVFEVLVLFVLVLYRLNIPHVSDPSIVVCLELPLIRLYSNSELFSLLLYSSNLLFHLLLRHLLASLLVQKLFEFLVVNVKWSEWLLLVMVGKSIKWCLKVVIVTSQLVFNLLLLIC